MAVLYRNHTESGPAMKSLQEKPRRDIDLSLERGDLSEEVLASLSNNQFLGIQRESRLQHVTKPSKIASEIRWGDSITISFTYQGKLNRELYLQTTAWQVLPPTVKEVVSMGNTWVRNWLLWEFFAKNGKRLIIHDSTPLVMSRVLSEDERKQEELNAVTTVAWYKENAYYDTILEWQKRGIPAKITLALIINQLDGNNNLEKERILMEQIFTQLERIKDYFITDYPNQQFDWNSLSPEFLAYYLNFQSSKIDTSTLNSLWITEDIHKKFSVLGGTRIVGAYWTNKPLWDWVKLMEDLTWNESIDLANKIFGKWPATELLIKLDWWNGIMIRRMIALWFHEGWLQFWRQNPDPASGFNIWTFQIGGSWSTPEISLRKYNSCLQSWIELARKHWINIVWTSVDDPRQKDLMTHLWYIEMQRWWASTFTQLWDPNLSNWAVVRLMSTTIQWGIDAIGKSVVSQMSYTKIDTTTLA